MSAVTLSGLAGGVLAPLTGLLPSSGGAYIAKAFITVITGGAAIISIILAFSGTLAAVIMSIPTAVMGGVSILLFGVIAASGIRLLVDQKVDYSRAKNLMLTAVVLIVGVCGVKIPVGKAALSGMTLATIVGMLLSLILWALEKAKLTNDFDTDN